MPKLIFVNLPVSDLARATAFYEAVGARKDERFCDGTASCMVFSETIHAMLLTHDKFRQFTLKAVAEAGAAGGRADPSPKQDHGFMYGRGFEDPDGHIWGVMWMDMAAAEKAMAPQPAA